MSTLLNAFVSGSPFNSNENSVQIVNNYNSTLSNLIYELFGITRINHSDDPYFHSTITQAAFGSDTDQDGLFNKVEAYYLEEDCGFTVCARRSIETSNDFLSRDYYSFKRGVALVRDPNWVPPSVVPIPAAIWLFMPALLGLLGFSRKARKSAA